MTRGLAPPLPGCRVLANRGLQDRAVATLENELTTAGVLHDLKVYPGTKHAFFNDQLQSDDADAAADSWQRVCGFFAEHVKGSEGGS